MSEEKMRQKRRKLASNIVVQAQSENEKTEQEEAFVIGLLREVDERQTSLGETRTPRA